MTRDDIIRMADDAGGQLRFYAEGSPIIAAQLARFAELVAAAEREECAKVCDEQGKGRKAMEHYAALTYAKATHDCAAAIRARGEQ